jgi:hypothetical protein
MVMKQIGVVATFTTKGLKTFKKHVNDLNVAMAKPIDSFKDAAREEGGWNKMLNETKTKTGRAALEFRKATHGMRGFKMEMLGVMFFGMAMQRMFGGLLKTAAGWTGIMDLLATTLGVIFLPIMLKLTEAFIPIMTWFLSLSDGTKLWIGAIVILGFVIGSMLMIIGQLALGIGSVMLAMAAAQVTVAGLVAGFFSLLASMFIIIGAIIMLRAFFGGFNKEFDDSVAKWQQNGGAFAKTIGFMVRILQLGGALMGVAFKNVGSIIIIAIQSMAKVVNLRITGMINKLIDAWNWIKKVAARGGNYTITKSIVADTSSFDAKIAEEQKKMLDRTTDLMLNTPTLSELYTGGPAVPETPVDNRTNAEKRGEGSSTTITNNFNGNTSEELKRMFDDNSREMTEAMERMK